MKIDLIEGIYIDMTIFQLFQFFNLKFSANLKRKNQKTKKKRSGRGGIRTIGLLIGKTPRLANKDTNDTTRGGR